MEANCKQCFSEHQNVNNGPASFRPDALRSYVRLQQQGLRPVMCEDNKGYYRVCHCQQVLAA